MSNPLLDAARNPTSLGVLMEFVREHGEYNMIMEFGDAVRHAGDLWRAVTRQRPPFAPAFSDGTGRVTFQQYKAAYDEPRWIERCQDLLKTHKTVTHVIQLVTGPSWPAESS